MSPTHLFALATFIAALVAAWLVRKLLRRRIGARLERLMPVLERAQGTDAAEQVVAAYRESFGDVVFIGELLGRLDEEATSRSAAEIEEGPWYETTQELLEAYVEVFWTTGTALDTCLDWLERTQALPGKEAIWSALAWEIPEPEILPRLWRAYQAESDVAVQRGLAPWISELVADALFLADPWARSPARQVAESLRERLEQVHEGASERELDLLDEAMRALDDALTDAAQHDGADRAAI